MEDVLDYLAYLAAAGETEPAAADDDPATADDDPATADDLAAIHLAAEFWLGHVMRDRGGER